MKVNELAVHCVQQINLVGPAAEILLVLPGRCNQSMKKRLAPGGPVGRINGEDMASTAPHVVVFFGAMDVLAWLTANGLIEAVGPDGKNIVTGEIR